MRKKSILAILMLIPLIFFTRLVFSLECVQISDTKQRESCLIQQLNNLARTESTLRSEIQYMDTQIALTTLKIQQTEEKIATTQKEIEILDTRIEGLDTSLNYLSRLLVERIIEGYKKRSVSIFNLLFDSSNASELIGKIKYMKTAQDNNQKVLVQVQETKLNFEEQKKLREEKKIELDNLKKTLDNQKATLNNQRLAKQKVLEMTRNDEKIYQQLLEQTRAEYAAIQGIIARKGSETELRQVKKGEMIASVIQGASCNSSGGHLHFIVEENNNVANPFGYLKSVDYTNCSGSSCGSGDGDPFNPSGGWDWPLDAPIELEQGYGSTWGVRNTWVGRIYNFHNGIDINGSSNSVIAVADGTLYRGIYSVGCPLSYVRLIHKDSNITTYYLHVYSN